MQVRRLFNHNACLIARETLASDRQRLRVKVKTEQPASGR